METKLTLSLEKEIIEQAKKYAQKQKTSLSNMVENYFYYLISDDAGNDIHTKEKTPITEKLLGSVKNVKFDPDELKEKYLMDKYLNA